MRIPSRFGGYQKLAEQIRSFTTLSHVMSSGAVIALARWVYGFEAQAWLCRIPARHFEPRAACRKIWKPDARVLADPRPY
jgi:hypothetical protein